MHEAVQLPAWMAHLPDDACLTAKEIMQIFGFAHQTYIHKCVREGWLPPPCMRRVSMINHESGGGAHAGKNYWKVGDIRAEIKRREKCQK
jgi:hypothetical protein